MKERLAAWYFRHFITPGRCPCSLPVRSKFLIRLCGRVDDYHARAIDRAQLRRFTHWYMADRLTTSNSASNATVTWTYEERS